MTTRKPRTGKIEGRATAEQKLRLIEAVAAAEIERIHAELLLELVEIMRKFNVQS